MNIVKVEHLSKTFKIRQRTKNEKIFDKIFYRKYSDMKAVDDLSFSIKKGEIVGYLGPNGAGKSTTIKMLTGVLAPSEGTILSNGYNPTKQRQKYVKHIGVVFGQRSQLWWDIPVYESLDLLKDMYRIEDSKFKKNMALFHEILGIEDFLKKPVRQLSLGQRMRADLCASLLHDPDIVFLDEPTIGLDAIAKKNIREFIQTINMEKEVTILLTTHDMTDIEKLCKRVIVIDKGKLLYDGDLETIRQNYGSLEHMKITMEHFPDNIDWFYHLGGTNVEIKDDSIVFTYERHKLSSAIILNCLIRDGCSISDFHVIGTETEDAIRNMYLSASN